MTAARIGQAREDVSHCGAWLRQESPPGGLGVLRPPDDILSLSRGAGHPWPALRTPSPPDSAFARVKVVAPAGFFCKRDSFSRSRWPGLCGTVGGMDAAAEPPWMDSRRVPRRPGHRLPSLKSHIGERGPKKRGPEGPRKVSVTGLAWISTACSATSSLRSAAPAHRAAARSPAPWPGRRRWRTPTGRTPWPAWRWPRSSAACT